jgi:predicted dehydrogenase
MSCNESLESTASTSVGRRDFLKAVSAAGVGLAIGATGCASDATKPVNAAARPSHAGAARYAIVGVGSRSQMYQNAIWKDYKEYAQLVGICDTNPGRLDYVLQRAVEAGAEPPRAYLPRDFDRMLSETQPDHLIVTTVDCFHHEYIVRAMDLGFDVITEKPMTNTAERCQKVLDACARHKKHIRVTFNYRYSPPRTQVKDLLMSGEIGDVLSVDFHWMLNTHHGADYFRRWHGWKKFSQGLMLHKATHHFDLANWWLGAVPVQVFATGKREFYTSRTAKRFGLTGSHERCHTCPEKDKCGFFFDLASDKNLKALYLDNEKYDGYFRDQCVWRDDHDIEDTMNVLVRYDNGVTMAYSLNAFNAWEGYSIAFNGTLGRLEHTVVEQIYVNGTSTEQGGIKPGVTTTIIPLRGPARKIDPWTGTGGHGGGDKVMLDEIFLPQPPPDKYLRAADERAGAASILIGIAANKCFATGQGVRIADLVGGLNYPDYAPMPSRTGYLPMPPKNDPKKDARS